MLSLDFYGFTLEVKTSSSKLVWDNQEYAISLPEALILKELIDSNNELVSRKKLIEVAWGSSDFIGGNSLAVAISNLRKVLKIRNVNIVNEPKVGYRLDRNSNHSFIGNTEKIERIDKNESSNKSCNNYLFKKFYIGMEVCVLFFLLLVFSDFLLAWVFVEHYEYDGVNVYELGDKKLKLGI